MSKKLKIEYQLNKNIFTLFSAYSFWEYEKHCGYKVAKTKFYFKIQKLLKDKKREIPSGKKLFKYFKKDHSVYYTVWVLRHSEFPEFKKLPFKEKNQKKDDWYKGFNKLLKEFYYEADIEKIWPKYKKEYLKKINGYEKEIPIVFERAINYLRMEGPFEFNKVVLIPNLLVGGGFGPLINKKSIIVLDPFWYKKKIYFSFILHEFLHSLINPLTDKKTNKNLVNETEDLYKKLTTKISRKHYPEWWMIVNEYIIRSIQGELFNKRNLGEYTSDQIKKGFHYIEWFSNQMNYFSKRTDTSFDEYLPEILTSLKESRKK